MRFPIFLTFTFMAMFSFNSIGQSNSTSVPSSDETHGFTFDFDKVNASIIDRIKNPTQANDYIKVITEDKSFTNLLKGETFDDTFNLKIKYWIETHQSIVIAVFKQRKDIVQEF
jgi:hypothetical protein